MAPLRLEGFSKLFLKSILDCLVFDQDPYYTVLNKSLIDQFAVFNSKCGELVKGLSESMVEKFAVLPYIDDVKEALSLDFLPFYDAKKTELDDSEYRLSLLFTNTSAYLKNRQKNQFSYESLNLRQLKHVTSVIYKNFINLGFRSSSDPLIYTHYNNNNHFETPLLPSGLSREFELYKSVALVLLTELKFTINDYYGEKNPS